MLENLDKIKVQDPVDLIIHQIRELISSGAIKPGEKLPPERKLAEHLGVSRGQVRDAINKLKIYGIVKVQPQSGTIVTGIGIIALEGLISDILELEDTDFKSLVDTRLLLEKEAARLAAIHRTESHILEIEKALNQYIEKLKTELYAVEEDLIFHIRIAEAAQNSVLKSLLMIITPDIVKSYNNLKVCSQKDNEKTIQQHREILRMIIEKDSKGAVEAMETHLSGVQDFVKSQNK